MDKAVKFKSLPPKEGKKRILTRYLVIYVFTTKIDSYFLRGKR